MHRQGRQLLREDDFAVRQVGYSGGFGGFDESPARISIATLVYAVARRKDLPQYKATLSYLTQKLETRPTKSLPGIFALLPGPRRCFRGMCKLGKNGTTCWSGN